MILTHTSQLASHKPRLGPVTDFGQGLPREPDLQKVWSELSANQRPG